MFKFRLCYMYKVSGLDQLDLTRVDIIANWLISHHIQIVLVHIDDLISAIQVHIIYQDASNCFLSLEEHKSIQIRRWHWQN